MPLIKGVQFTCTYTACVARMQLLLVILLAHCPVSTVQAANDVFIYSSVNTIRGVDLTLSQEYLITTATLSPVVNALGLNTDTGIIYYGDQSSIYYWDPSLGSGGGSHSLINNFSNGAQQAPISNLDSASGSYLDGVYYIGSENDNGFIEELYALSMSSDGRQLVATQPLNLLNACNCTQEQIGGFGDIAAVREGADIIIYGSSASLANGSGSSAGIWRFNITTGDWQLLAGGQGGQLANSPSGAVYTNIGNSIRLLDTATGATGSTSLFVTSANIYDFSGGYNYDYGDAPDSYGAAYHKIPSNQSSGIQMGPAEVDNEPYSLNANVGSVDGAGDDSVGTDDEDAITTAPALFAGDTDYGLSISCSAGSFVAAWVDVNLNGKFDTNERNSNHPVTCVAGQTSLTWTGMTIPAAGDAYIRLRVASTASEITRPTGLADSGEVEDHPLQIQSQPIGNSGNCPVGSISTVYDAQGLPIRIGPNANSTALSTINVSQGTTITDINLLGVNGRHTRINDLTFEIRRNGITRSLYGRSCGSQNHFNFGFDDEASGTPPCPPTDGGDYPPTQSLSVFDGQDAVGDWTLAITDNRNRARGRLDGWSLEVCAADPGGNFTPDVRLGKSVTINNTDVAVTLRVLNAGNTPLDSFSVVDDLDAVFGAGNYSITQPPQLLGAPAGFTANTSYTGESANSELLAGSTILLPQQAFDIVFSVLVSDAASGAAGSYMNQATVAANYTGTLISDLSGSGLDLGNDHDDPTPVNLLQMITLEGTVFVDTSSVAQSHDGIQQSPEQGMSLQTVQLRNTATGEILDTVQTGIDGRWRAQVSSALAGQSIDVRLIESSEAVPISESPVTGTGLPSDGLIQLTPQHNDNIVGLDFGVIPPPVLLADHSRSSRPDTHVRFPHTYVAGSHGNVLFDVTTASAPQTQDWSVRLVEDVNCNQQLDANELEIAQPIAVTPGQEICLLVDGYVPSTAADGELWVLELGSLFTAEDASSTAHGVTVALLNTDVTRVSAISAGKLVLEKTVRNISSAGAVSTSNTALPGQVLEYVVEFENRGLGPITDLVINDQAPAFSLVQPASAVCNQVPAGMSCAGIISGDAVRWDFSGALAAGASGSVSYRIVVD